MAALRCSHFFMPCFTPCSHCVKQGLRSQMKLLTRRQATYTRGLEADGLLPVLLAMLSWPPHGLAMRQRKFSGGGCQRGLTISDSTTMSST